MSIRMGKHSVFVSIAVIAFRLLCVLGNSEQPSIDAHHMERRAQECASFTPMLCATTPLARVTEEFCPSCEFDVDLAFGECPLVAAGYVLKSFMLLKSWKTMHGYLGFTFV